MFTITDAACARLTDMLADCPDKIAARIVLKGDRIRLRRGASRPGDKAFDYQGRVVALLGQSLVERLADRVLDIRKTADGPKLGLRRSK